MNTHKKILLWLLGIILCCLTVLGAGYWYQKYVLNGYPDTPNFAQRFDVLQRNSTIETVLIFHKPGCSDCQHVRSTVKEVIKTHHQYNYIVIDVTKKEAKSLITKFGITQVPTIIRLIGNQVLASTTSTQPQQVRKVMTGEK